MDANPDSESTLESYVLDNKRSLESFIKKYYTGLSYQKTMLFMLARWFEVNKPDDRYLQPFKQSAFEISEIIKENENEGNQSEREVINYRSLADMKTLLEIKENEQHTLPYLLLAMVTLQPTLRGSFYSGLKFMSQANQNNGEDNYLFINKRTKKMHYIVNKDKVSGKYGFNDEKHKKLEIQNTELKRLIIQSLDTNPREYVFENESGRPYIYSTLLNYLRKITEVDYISFNMFRSAHVNDLYKDNTSRNGEREKLAILMRHSTEASRTYYLKPILFEEEQENILEYNAQPRERMEALLQERKKEKEALSNINDPTNKQFIRKKKDMIRKLNQRGSTPTQQSIDKYSLVRDGEGEWS